MKAKRPKTAKRGNWTRTKFSPCVNSPEWAPYSKFDSQYEKNVLCLLSNLSSLDETEFSILSVMIIDNHVRNGVSGYESISITSGSNNIYE